VQIQAGTNYGPQGSGGLQEGKQFLPLYIGKNLLKRNIWPNSIKLCTNHSHMKGIQAYSNEEPSPLQGGGDTHKSGKIGWGHLKIFFS
jgi:hypothetical protein